MTPDDPQDPQKGAAVPPEEAKDAKQAPEASEAAEQQPEPKPKRSRAKKAEPETSTEPTEPAEEPVAETETAPEPAEEPEAEPAAEPEPVAETAEAPEAEAVEQKPKRSRRRNAAEPEAPAETAPARRRDARRPAETGVQVRAHAKYVRTSARKARLVCDHIRGKDVVEARAILAFTPRAAATPWLKLLESAVANAEHNHELVGEDLRIAAVHADEGPTLKRFRPRAMGRATRIRKRTSHLTITLTPKES
jgi:ribosomal protein L22